MLSCPFILRPRSSCNRPTTVPPAIAIPPLHHHKRFRSIKNNSLHVKNNSPGHGTTCCFVLLCLIAGRAGSKEGENVGIDTHVFGFSSIAGNS
jgi:hypothetical protein